jgi:hypothetical protein
LKLAGKLHVKELIQEAEELKKILASIVKKYEENIKKCDTAFI